MLSALHIFHSAYCTVCLTIAVYSSSTFCSVGSITFCTDLFEFYRHWLVALALLPSKLTKLWASYSSFFACAHIAVTGFCTAAWTEELIEVLQCCRPFEHYWHYQKPSLSPAILQQIRNIQLLNMWCMLSWLMLARLFLVCVGKGSFAQRHLHNRGILGSSVTNPQYVERVVSEREFISWVILRCHENTSYID